MGDKRTVLIPLARLKDEDGELRVPYSKDHIGNTPEIDGTDEISAESDRALRDHYGIDRADQELRDDNDSYATLVTRTPTPRRGGSRIRNHSRLRRRTRSARRRDSVSMTRATPRRATSTRARSPTRTPPSRPTASSRSRRLTFGRHCHNQCAHGRPEGARASARGRATPDAIRTDGAAYRIAAAPSAATAAHRRRRRRRGRRGRRRVHRGVGWRLAREPRGERPGSRSSAETIIGARENASDENAARRGRIDTPSGTSARAARRARPHIMRRPPRARPRSTTSFATRPTFSSRGTAGVRSR